MMQQLISRLHSGNHSLAVAATDGTITTYDGRGVADLHRLLTQSPGMLQGACVADKVVGKGAAALMALGGVEKVHADAISTPALLMLRQAGIQTTFGREVPHIINRQGTGICPVETLCMPCTTPGECLPPITAFLRNQSSKTPTQE